VQLVVVDMIVSLSWVLDGCCVRLCSPCVWWWHQYQPVPQCCSRRPHCTSATAARRHSSSSLPNVKQRTHRSSASRLCFL